METVMTPDQIKELRRFNKDQRDTCLRTVHKSPIPDAVARTLCLILDNIGSPSNYTLAWISQEAIAEKLGKNDRTIRCHVKAITAAGLLNTKKMGAREARTMLKERFGYDAKLAYTHFLTFYSVNRDHPFWKGEQGAVEAVVAIITENLAEHNKKRTRPASNPVAGDLSNPVARRTSNPVARRTSNPVAADRQPQIEEETILASSEPPYPLFERPHVGKPGIALRAGRGADSPDSSPGSVSISDLIHHEEVSQRVANVEAEILTLTQFNHNTALDPNSVASRVGKLWKDWKETLGRYPEDWMVADTINSAAFRGIKALNWGTLTSTTQIRGSSFRDRLFNGVVDCFRRYQQCSNSQAVLTTAPSPVPDQDEAECLGADW